MTMTAEQKAARLALIKKVAAKYQQPKVKVKSYDYDEEVVRINDDATNINAYTDGSKYLAEHYGDRVADQNSYESYEGWN